MINLKLRAERTKSSDFVLYMIAGTARYPMGWYATEAQASKMQRLSRVRSPYAFVVVKEDR